MRDGGELIEQINDRIWEIGTRDLRGMDGERPGPELKAVSSRKLRPARSPFSRT